MHVAQRRFQFLQGNTFSGSPWSSPATSEFSDIAQLLRLDPDAMAVELVLSDYRNMAFLLADRAQPTIQFFRREGDDGHAPHFRRSGEASRDQAPAWAIQRRPAAAAETALNEWPRSALDAPPASAPPIYRAVLRAPRCWDAEGARSGPDRPRAHQIARRAEQVGHPFQFLLQPAGSSPSIIPANADIAARNLRIAMRTRGLPRRSRGAGANLLVDRGLLKTGGDYLLECRTRQ